MYLRQTRRRNKDGTVASYLQLAHNERRDGSGPAVARVIHNFGRLESVDRDALRRLGRSIFRFLDDGHDGTASQPAAGGRTPDSPPPSVPVIEEVFAEITSQSQRRLLGSALVQFAKRGYHATTTREISAEAAMSPAAVYIHYSTKEEVLFTISRLAHKSVLELTESTADTGSSATTALHSTVTAFVAWYIRHVDLGRVAQYHLHDLTPEHYQEIVRLGRAALDVMTRIIDRGKAAGEFQVGDAWNASLAIQSMGVDVIRWYRPGIATSADEIISSYADLALRMVGAGAAASTSVFDMPVICSGS